MPKITYTGNGLESVGINFVTGKEYDDLSQKAVDYLLATFPTEFTEEKGATTVKTKQEELKQEVVETEEEPIEVPLKESPKKFIKIKK